MRAVLSFDTETKGLDHYAPDFRVFMIQWADADGEWWVAEDWSTNVPAQGLDAPWHQPFLDAVAQEEVLVAANASFDIHALHAAGIVDLLSGAWRVHDALTLARVCVPGRFQYKLEGLGHDLLGADATAQQRELKAAAKEHGISWTLKDKDYYGLWQLEPALMEKYGMEDVRLAFDLFRRIWDRASVPDLQVYDMEIKGVAPILRAAEREGVLVDKARLATLKARLLEERDELRCQLIAQGMSDEALGAEATEDEAAGKASSKALLADLLRIGVPLYRKTPKSGEVNAKTGKRNPDQFAVNKDALKEFEKKHPVVKDLLAWRSKNILLRTFVAALEKADPRVHTSFSQAEARTSRMCIAQGSLIEAPRNLLLHPRGVPIEDIRVGQYVYSHGDDGVPRAKRVLDKWCTGEKRVLRLVWRASGSKSYLGELKATADHRIRMEDGSYRRMDELRANDKLAYVGRSMNAAGRSYISWSGDRKVFEHQHLLDAPLVHHINGIKEDNRVENLLACATPEEHGRMHAGMLCAQRPAQSRRLPCPFPLDEFQAAVSGGIRSAMRSHGHEHAAWKRWAVQLGVEIPDARRTDKTNNHRVVMVVSDGETLPCWDLEVEDTPCFVANEIGVHNSTSKPNTQNLPSVEEEREGQERAVGVRDVLIPGDGQAFIVGDYKNIEVFMMAHYIGDAQLIADLEAGIDLYAVTAARVEQAKGNMLTAHDCRKDGPYAGLRQKAKTTALTAMYGGGARLLGVRLGIPTADAAKLKQEVLDAIPGYWALDERVKSAVRGRHFPHVVSLLGRRLYVPAAKPYVALNTILQGSSAEIMKLGLIAATPAIAEYGYRPLLVVHDELLGAGPAEHAPTALLALKAAMESVYPLSPRLMVSGDWSTDSYGAAK